jgi:hypothetical protein
MGLTTMMVTRNVRFHPRSIRRGSPEARSMLRSVLLVISAVLAAALPASATDPKPTMAPSTLPSPAASPAIPAVDELPAGGFDVFAGSPVTIVSLGLYSGLPDPSWELSEEEASALTALLETLPCVEGSPPSGGLGYHGFSIERLTPAGMPRLLVAFQGTVSDPLSSHLSYLDDPQRSVERFLRDSGRDQLSATEILAPGLDP